MKKQSLIFATLALFTLFAQVSFAAGDVKKGADVFAEECGDCHSAIPGKSKKGPTLTGIIGRKAGTVANFADYSDSMKNSGIIWTAEKIDAYIAHPKKIVPAGKMKYDGLDDATSRADVIAYISSLK